MKARKRGLCLILAALLTLAMYGSCLAATQASPTLFSYGVWAHTGEDSGELDIHYIVEANKTANSLGISALEIYTGGGVYVETIYGTTDNRLMAEDLGTIDRVYTYQGEPNTRYYAIATIEATIGSKYDSRRYVTDFAVTPP